MFPKLLGPDAERKFKALRESGKIKYDTKGTMNSLLAGVTNGDEITLNPNSFAFDPDYSLPTGSKSQNKYAKAVTKAFNKAYKKSDASSRREYAIGVIIHEFLHAIGTFGPDASEDIFGKVDSSRSQRNQRKVIEDCLSGDN